MFLVWNNPNLAETSLAAVNAVYGCPYVAENGYRMDRWDTVTQSNDGNQWGFSWGFSKPVSHLGKLEQDLRASLVPGFIEHDEKPDEFKPEDEIKLEEEDGE